jgi:hypothetical protein
MARSKSEIRGRYDYAYFDYASLTGFAVVTSWGLSMPAPLPPTASFEDGLPADFHFTHDFTDDEARDVMQAANAFR